MTEQIVLVFCGPSGAGKGTVIKLLRWLLPHLFLMVSVTTRGIRPGEVEGIDYWYVDDDKFDALQAAGKFIVGDKYKGSGHRYADYHPPRDRNVVVFEITADAAVELKAVIPHAIIIMIMPPGRTMAAKIKWLRGRLIGRGTDPLDRIESRLETGKREILLAPDIADIILVNRQSRITALRVYRMLWCMYQERTQRVSRVRRVCDQATPRRLRRTHPSSTKVSA